MEILAVRDLSFTYPLCSKPSVHNVSFAVEKGDFTVLCGATGSGKSTLLRMLKRELTPMGELTGRVYFKGTALEELDEGDILSVHMNDGEPVQNVPRSIKEEGHQILKLINNNDGTYDLIVRKVGD